MRPIVESVSTPIAPEVLANLIAHEPGCVLLRSGIVDGARGRYSMLARNPFRIFRSRGPRCDLSDADGSLTSFGSPWQILRELLARYEILDEIDLPYPLGGAFGYWGYDLRHSVEPKLARRTLDDLELPDCCAGFYGSLAVFDHELRRTWIVATGLAPDGSRELDRARREADEWQALFVRAESEANGPPSCRPCPPRPPGQRDLGRKNAASNVTREDFLGMVVQAQDAIQRGEIYQVNLAQRLEAWTESSAWELFLALSDASPAPYAAYLNCGDFQIVSASPELFLKLSGAAIQTRPIKGTRPRSADPTRDAQLAFELQSSPKELAELVMITDLLRNDLGKVCEYGTIRVPDLARLEKFAQVQHLVSTVEGRLRPEVTHLDALHACFPGGSVTGAPKFRAMEWIDELELVTRGPYTGCAGYLGFNRESQLSILIRTAVQRGDKVWYHAGAGIVADSIAEAEYEETLAKAEGWLAVLQRRLPAPAKEPA